MLNNLRKILQKSGESQECGQCSELTKELKKLREENASLHAELARVTGSKTQNIPIGAHTPPSQIPFKKQSTEENRKAKGGARKGHKGVGRKSFEATEAKKITVPAPQLCPSCNQPAVGNGKRERSVIDASPERLEKVIYECERSRCPRCGKTYMGAVPVLPKTLYGNTLLSQIAVMHYLHGIALGRLGDIFGKDLCIGSIIGALHRMAKIFEPLIPVLVQEYRDSFVRHADETSWNIDGERGWAWLFSSDKVAILFCENTRASSVPARVFGTKPLSGFLVVDRYKGYSKVPCLLQFCFAHLLRDVTKLLKEFPDSQEIASFVDSLAGLLSQSMRLQTQPISDHVYLENARSLQSEIKKLVATPQKHLGIISVQSIFTDNDKNLYHWVENREVPCHNNTSERQIRRQVISRKISFGSQSTQGAKTRSILYSVLATARKRLSSDAAVEVWLKNILDAYALNPKSFDIVAEFNQINTA